ncbi:MAG: class I SAM-dependent methyltransferase, partial [Flavobacterium sp.]
FKSYSKYYDQLYHDKNYNAETDYLVNLITKYRENTKSIIDLGCGTGKHAKLLANRGFEVTGLDLSQEMISIAKQSSDLDFIIGDITNFKLDSTFDVALSIFHVFSYLTDNDVLLNAFSNINRHLVVGGVLIVDVWHTPAVHSQLPEPRVKIVENDTYKIVRKATPAIDSLNNMVDVRYELDVLHKETATHEIIIEDHHIRHFSKPEIELLSKCTGFKVLHSEELITAKKPSEQTWGVCYILQKLFLIAIATYLINIPASFI